MEAAIQVKKFVKREAKRFMVRYGTSELTKSAFTRNVSETGMCLQTNTVYKPGTRIQVQFELEDRTFFMLARVVWAKTVPSRLVYMSQCGMGICFIEPSINWIQYYNKWIKKSF